MLAVVAVAIVRAITGHPTPDEWALTPDRLGASQVWLFVTSALIVSGPPVVQLVGMIATLAFAQRRLGAAFTGAVMCAAHVGATVVAYGALLAVTGDADAQGGQRLDYGISAVWMGALGALWLTALPRARGREPRALLVVAAGVGAFVFGIVAFHTLAATEHALAFVIGAASAAALRHRAQAAVGGLEPLHPRRAQELGRTDR